VLVHGTAKTSFVLFWFLKARNQVLWFGEKYTFRGKDFCFYYMFHKCNKNICGHNPTLESTKNKGHCPDLPHLGCGSGIVCAPVNLFGL